MADSERRESQWTGHNLYDLNGDKIGKVEGVRYGDVTGSPTWLMVETGLLGLKKVFVPAAEVRRAGDRLSVPYTKDRVKDSPKIDNEEAPTEAEEGYLCRYYGMRFVSTPAEPAEGCEEMDTQDGRPAG